jgi:hypothetical protein
MKKIMSKVKEKSMKGMIRIQMVLSDNRGETFIDTAIKILISVVIGALLLAGLYTLMEDTVLPELQQRISDMFDYNG